MVEKTNEYFIYSHNERDFSYIDDDKRKEKFSKIVKLPSVKEIEDALENERIDGLLVLDQKAERWYLTFGTHLGIVAERTARRQADSISRTGYRIPGKYTISSKFPLEELSESNIGDLYKSAQQKYIKGTLTGMEVDDQTGVPSQLAERAKLLREMGYEDELTKAEFEKKRKQETMSIKQKAGESKTEAKTPSVVKTKTTSTVSKAPLIEEAYPETDLKKGLFFEAKNIKEYVENNFTVISAKGVLHDNERETEELLVFKQQKLAPKQWNDTVVYLQNGDLLQVTLEKDQDVLYVTSVEK